MDALIDKLGKYNLTMEVENNNPQRTAFAQPSMATTKPQQSAVSNAFGIMIPGRPVRYDFSPVDQTGSKFALQLSSPGDLPNPLVLVNEVVGFLGAPIAPDRGVLVYWQISNGQEQSGFELLGSLSMDQPSQIFRTGWSEHDQFLSLPPNQPVMVTIGLSIEPLELVQNVAASTTASNARRPLVARQIAQDLYNFMQSFDASGGGSNSNSNMMVPRNIFERWWKRFEAKSKRDPNFFLKSSD